LDSYRSDGGGERMVGRIEGRGTYSSVNSPPYGSHASVLGRRGGMGHPACSRLTARTLSNEVLPAFCRPIIVISISVALLLGSARQLEIRQSKTTLSLSIGGLFFFFPSPLFPLVQDKNVWLPLGSSRHTEETDQNNLNSQSYTRLKSPAMMM